MSLESAGALPVAGLALVSAGFGGKFVVDGAAACPRAIVATNITTKAVKSFVNSTPVRIGIPHICTNALHHYSTSIGASRVSNGGNGIKRPVWNSLFGWVEHDPIKTEEAYVSGFRRKSTESREPV